MQIRLKEITLSNIKHFIVGNFRYYLYYSRFKNLIPRHIREQIECRINSMNKECYNSGSCVKCGCATTALQMCDKACEGHCYPIMLSKSYWNRIPNRGYISANGILWLVDKEKKLFIKRV